MVRGQGIWRAALLVTLIGAGLTACGDDPKPTPPPAGEPDADASDADVIEAEEDIIEEPDEDVVEDVPPDVPMLEDVEDAEEDAAEDAEDAGEEDVEEDVPVGSECSLDDPCREGVCNLENGACEDRDPCFGPLDCLGGQLGDRVCAGCPDGQCPEEGGVCRDRCDTSVECPQGELCVDGGCGAFPGLGCVGDGDCQGGQVCDSQAFACVDAPTCAEDTDCVGGRRCDVGTQSCRQCLRDVDCGGLQRCISDIFVSACEEPSRCFGDQDCQGLRFCDVEGGVCLNPVCQEDRFEPNNRINENTVFLREGVSTGLRLCGGEADLFLVTVPSNKPLVALTRQEGGPLKLFVYPGGSDPFGSGAPEPIAESTGSEREQGVIVPATPQGGTYLLHVTSPVEGPKNYSLRILFDPPERVIEACGPDEENVGPDTAPLLQRDLPRTGEICPEGELGDEDWFRFQVGLGVGLELSLLYPVQGDGLTMAFFKRVGNNLVDHRVPVQERSFGKLSVFGAQDELETIFIRVTGLRPEARGDFLLSLVAIEDCEDDAQEPNDDPGSAVQLLIDPRTRLARVEALAVCFTDTDYFGLTAQGGRGIQASASLPDGVDGAPPALSILELRGDVLVPVGNARSDGRRSVVSLGSTAQGGATYLFEIQATSEGVTPYILEVELLSAPFCDTNDALEPSDADNVVPVESTSLGAFLCAGEEDWYRISAEAGAEADLSLGGPPGVVFDLRRLDDLSLVVEGASGRLLTTIEDEGELAIVVRGQSEEMEGDYTLRTNLTADPPANDVCEGAQQLRSGQRVAGTLRGARDNITSVDPIGCFTLDGSPDVVYAFTIGVTSDVDITVTPGLGGLQPTVFLQRDCDDPGSILEGLCATDFDDARPFDGVVSLSQRLTAGTYFLWVDGATEGAVGDFEVLLQAR